MGRGLFSSGSPQDDRQQQEQAEQQSGDPKEARQISFDQRILFVDSSPWADDLLGLRR